MKPVALALVALSLLFALAFSALIPAPARSASPAAFLTPAAYVPHAPILINGDANFTAANGVTGGSGTAADPYVIEGWDINGSEHDWPSPLEIQNTGAQFIIRNVSVHDFGGYSPIEGTIDLTNVSNGRIENVSMANSTFGLTLNGVAFVGIINNTFAGNQYNVYGQDVANATLAGNAFHESVYLERSEDVAIQGNHALWSLRLQNSLRVTVLANGEIPGGISLSGTTAAEYASHTIAPDNFVNGLPIRYYANCAGAVIDGISAGSVIVANCSNIRVVNLRITGEPNIVQDPIFLAFVHGADVAANAVNLSGTGIRVVSSSDVTIERNNITNTFGIAIDVFDTHPVVVQNNTLAAFVDRGISVWSSPYATVTGNTLSRTSSSRIPSYVLASGNGIEAVDTSGAVFAENRFSGLWTGIMAGLADRMVFRGNTFDGGVIGIDFYSASNATLQANEFQNVGLRISGAGGTRPSPWDLNVTVTEDNLVNGRPLRYYHGCDGLNLDGTNAGQVIVADCSNVQIQRLNITLGVLGITLLLSDHATIASNWISGNTTGFPSGPIVGGGITVQFSSNVAVSANHVTNGITSLLSSFVTIEQNDVSARLVGIQVAGGNYTTIDSNIIRASSQGVNLMSTANDSVTANQIVGNTLGIYLTWSWDSRIYHNNFVNNTHGASQVGSANITWDDGYPSGGNYWSDYNGTDHCSGVDQANCTASDGIGDSPYTIESDHGLVVDRFPLMAPYVAPQTPSGVSLYVLLGLGGGIAGAVAVAVYLIWRLRRHPASPEDSGPESRPGPPNGR